MRLSLEKISFLLFLVAAVNFIVSCAQIGSISGGSKDKTPPEIIEMTPDNYSKNFTDKKIEIKFNEFIVLDKINEQLLISPPIKETPDFKLKGKSLVIKFKEKLKENTTYSLFFGDAIKDLTEGNSLHNFTYVFSTGDYVDSLSMFGNVYGAFDLKPVEKVAVMLYRNNNDSITFDSLPMKVQPYYLSRTDKNGNYFLTGLADDNYLVFALNDKNNNYIFDQPSEEIAFLDSLYHPFYIPPKIHEVDSITNDSTSINIDSLQLLPEDSLKINNEGSGFGNDTTISDSVQPVDLYMFLQEDTVMRLLEAKLFRLNTVRFIFSKPAEKVNIVVENKPVDSTWFIQEWSKNKDTLIWFINESSVKVDTFNILFSYLGDTLNYLYLPIKPKEKKLTARQRKKEEVKVHVLGFSTNMKGNVIPGTTLYIEFNQPVKKTYFDSVLFINGKDSIWSPRYRFIDSLNRKMVFPYKIEPGNSYSLILPDSCIKDWNGYYNKAKKLKFSSKELKSYGALTLNLKPLEKYNYIIQFINKKEKVFKELYFKQDTVINYEYINPGSYTFKIIFDKNGNKKWDTGNYLKKIEPENVTYYQKIISIRANWEIEETWKFSLKDKDPMPGSRKK